MPDIGSIDIIRAQDRHFNDFGWLKTYWLFSFAKYYDPHNIQFGALRVSTTTWLHRVPAFQPIPMRRWRL